MAVKKNLVIWIAALFVANACAAFAVVYAKHKARSYHIEVSQLRAIADDLDVEWGRLQLEEGTLAEYGRIEKISREKLGMKMPQSNEIRLVFE